MMKLGTHHFTDFNGADVARKLHDLLKRQPSVGMYVVDNIFPDFVGAVFTEENGIGRDNTGFQGGGCTENLHGRSRLIRIGNGPVSPIAFLEAAIRVGVEDRMMRYGQQGAGFWRHDDDDSGFGPKLGDGIFQCLFGNVLDRAVNGQNQVFPTESGYDLIVHLESAAQCIP